MPVRKARSSKAKSPPRKAKSPPRKAESPHKAKSPKGKSPAFKAQSETVNIKEKDNFSVEEKIKAVQLLLLELKNLNKKEDSGASERNLSLNQYLLGSSLSKKKYRNY
jgi:hypothetical protein